MKSSKTEAQAHQAMKKQLVLMKAEKFELDILFENWRQTTDRKVREINSVRGIFKIFKKISLYVELVLFNIEYVQGVEEVTKKFKNLSDYSD